MMNCEPVKLTPTIKDYIWGGRRLITGFGKVTKLDRAAESWELSANPDGESVIASGKYKGYMFSEYIERNGRKCIGSCAAETDAFPILIKLIDAKDNLSIQVHPDDEYALKVENGYGKTEMWYIVDCEKDAYIYYGLKNEITREELKAHIENNTILNILNKVPVKRGDVFFIPAGTIHAICAGVLICEVQQNSNTTYRIYDYNRKDKNGHFRELHTKKALDTATLYPTPERIAYNDKTLVSCKYFTAEKVECNGNLSIPVDCKSFRSLIITEGDGTLIMNDAEITLSKGDSIFIPAQDSYFSLYGNLEGILSYI